MDTLVASPPAVTSQGSTVTARALNNKFVGDAIATVADGLNAALASYQATWTVGRTESDAIIAFLRAHRGQTFWWTPPRAGTPRQWQATTWTRTSLTADEDQIQVTFAERIVW